MTSLSYTRQNSKQNLFKNIKKDASKYIKSINDSIVESETALAQGLNKEFERTTIALEKLSNLPKKFKESSFSLDLRDLGLKKKKPSEDPKNRPTIQLKPPTIGKLTISSIELLDMKQEGSILCTLLFEAQKKQTTLKKYPYIWSDQFQFNISDLDSILFIELFSSTEEFLGLATCSKFDTTQSVIQIVDEFHQAIPNAKLIIDFQYELNDNFKQLIEKEKTQDKSPEATDQTPISKPLAKPLSPRNELNIKDVPIILDEMPHIEDQNIETKQHEEIKGDEFKDFEETIDQENPNEQQVNDSFEEKPNQTIEETITINEKYEKRIKTLETQVEELLYLVYQSNKDINRLNTKVTESKDDLSFYKNKIETLERHIDFIRSQQGRKMIEWVYLILSYFMRFVSLIFFVFGYIYSKMKFSKLDIDTTHPFVDLIIKENKERIMALEQSFKEQSEQRFLPVLHLPNEKTNPLSQEADQIHQISDLLSQTETKNKPKIKRENSNSNWFQEMENLGGYDLFK